MTAITSTASPQAVSQSLAHGPLGQALLLADRARRGAADPHDAHAVLAGIGPLVDGPTASLFFGAPAMTWVLHTASADMGRYAGPLHHLDSVVNNIVQQRLTAAHARIDTGTLPVFAEYDLLRGLTGLAVLLLHRQPHGRQTRPLLEYLVRLTRPLPGPRGDQVPGWWVSHGPLLTDDLPGGHANSSISHGISGPLAVLALAARAGITVDGHEEAIRRICRWLDSVQKMDARGVRWARYKSLGGLTAPAPPSWCYGTPGIARAMQLAALVTDDHERQLMAERAIVHHLADSAELDRITDNGLCHGLAGILRTVQRAAEDAADADGFARCTHLLKNKLVQNRNPEEMGFLTGSTGTALVTEASDFDSLGQWDSCLLLA